MGEHARLLLIVLEITNVSRECVPDVDADIDRDGVPNWIDNCRDISNTQQTDLDRNGIGDACQQSEVRIGKIWGDIKYVDGRGRVRPFRATAKLMREGEYGSNLFDESTNWAIIKY